MLDAKGSLNHRVIDPFLTWSLSQIRAGARRLVALLSLEFGIPQYTLYCISHKKLM